MVPYYWFIGEQPGRQGRPISGDPTGFVRGVWQVTNPLTFFLNIMQSILIIFTETDKISIFFTSIVWSSET